MRAAWYKLYCATKPKGWVHTLDDDGLKREIDRWYYSVKGTHVNFEHPQAFSEKIQWLKVYDKDPRKAMLSDKLAMRAEIARKVGEEVLPKVYRIWDRADEIRFDGIEQPFFLKCNTGSGMMIRVDNPALANLDEVRTKAESWFTRDFAADYFEMHYTDIVPKAYAEERLDDIKWEYQAWCFDGKVAFISAIREPHGVNEKQTFSPTWEKLPFVTSNPAYQGTIERPDCLEQLLTWSERLAEGFTFVRVDWYGTGHGLMFSEMSFTPAYGIVRWVPSDYDQKVGALMHLPIED